MFFREANVKDIPKIVAINNECVLPKNENGFVLNSLDNDDVAAIICQHPQSIYVCGANKNAIAAFVMTAPDEDQKILEKVQWMDPEKRIIFFEKSRLYIKKMVVHPTLRRKGYGTFLYTTLQDQSPSRILYSFISRAPFDNQTSIQFHNSMKFNLFGRYAADLFYGFKNYRSELYVHFS